MSLRCCPVSHSLCVWRLRGSSRPEPGRPWVLKCCLPKAKDKDFLPALTCFSWALGGYEQQRVGSHLCHPLCRGDAGLSR